MKTQTAVRGLLCLGFLVFASGAGATVECKGDLDSNNTINSNDISLLVNYWLNYKNLFGVAPVEQLGWVDGMDLYPLNVPDGVITSNDISVLVNHWLSYRNVPVFPIPCLP